MSMKSRVLAAVGGVGLTLAVAVTAVTAGGPLSGLAAPAASPSASPVASSSPATTITTTTGPGAAFAFGGVGGFGGMAAMPNGATFDMNALAAGMGDPAKCQDVQGKLAANLGVTTDTLEAAIKKTIIQEIDQAEKDGKLTADQAKTARDRVNNATDLCAGFGIGMAGPGGKGGDRPTTQGGGMAFGMFDGAAYEAVAKYFGISTDQLKQDATDLGSLQAIAAKYGKDNDAGKAGLKSTIEQAIKDQLTKNGVPQEMIDRIVSEFDANFDSLYTAKLGGGMPGGGTRVMPGGGQTGPGRRMPHTSPSPSPTSSTQ